MQLCRTLRLLLATLISLSTFFATLVLLPAIALAQAGLLDADITLLKKVMPDAASFSEKAGDPPVYRAFGAAEQGGQGELIGYLFETPDYPPEEIGYSAPIEVLLGMALEGIL